MKSLAALKSGFTLIEVLVALALLGILVAVLTSTLTGSLSLNRKSQLQLSRTSTAQQVMEIVRGSWLSQTNYDRACVVDPNNNNLSGYNVKYQNLDSRANNPTALTTPSIKATDVLCAAQATTSPIPVMRRITVSSGTTGAQNISLTLDVLRPQ